MAKRPSIGNCRNNMMINLQPFSLTPFICQNEFTEQKFWSASDVVFMHRALALAQKGAAIGEVPVGAVIVHDDQVIGEGFNAPIQNSDATAHAEIVALRAACKQLNNYRLPPNSTIYVTLEPCTMCIGALIHSRVSRLVFATFEPRAGMVGSQMDLSNQSFYNHHLQVAHGLFAEKSARLLKQFFKQRRQAVKSLKQAASI